MLAFINCKHSHITLVNFKNILHIFLLPAVSSSVLIYVRSFTFYEKNYINEVIIQSSTI